MCPVENHNFSSGPHPSQATRYSSMLHQRERIRRRTAYTEPPLISMEEDELGPKGSYGLVYPGHVESRVDPHGPWEMEPNCHWVDDFLNGKRTLRLAQTPPEEAGPGCRVTPSDQLGRPEQGSDGNWPVWRSSLRSTRGSFEPGSTLVYSGGCKLEQKDMRCWS